MLPFFNLTTKSPVVLPALTRKISDASKFSLRRAFEEDIMSYRSGGAGGGGNQRRGRGGPNRGGGRGRGGGGRGRGGRGRGGGGPPSGLSGREIGMYYAKKSKQKKIEREDNTRAVVNIDGASTRNIHQILSNVRHESGADEPSTSGLQNEACGWSTIEQTSQSSSPGCSSWSSIDPSAPLPPEQFSRMEYEESKYSSTPLSSSDGRQHGEPKGERECRSFISRPPGLGGPLNEGPLNPTNPGLLGVPSHTLHGGKEQVDAVGSAEAKEVSQMMVEGDQATPIVAISNEMDKKFRDEILEARNSNRQYKKMLDFRQKLPSWKAQNELLELIKSTQVSVISGETGCGKTTQVPQFILDDAIMNGWGSRCQVICTQPRRISAIAVSQRVASERGEPLGKSSGFQIRLENTLPRTRASILYCTTGILLRRLIGDPILSEASHVIIDEIHERNISSDFLTIIMRDLLPKRPDLKLILMSATLNAEMFSEYFNNAPTFTIQNVAFPVAEYFLEDIIKMTNYRPQPARNQFKPRPHYGKGREEHLKKEEEKAEKEEYLKSLEAIGTLPRRVTDALRDFDETNIELDLVLSLIRYIVSSMGDGAILVFLPGWDTITKLNDMLLANPAFRGRNYVIIPLHSMMPTTNQQKVFDRPPEGVRKIVIATNIAETSITIDDVVYVIDCGKVKETTYDAAHHMACLDAVWVSKASARQRRGRAGRVQAGVCFHLYTKFRHDKMAEFQEPEILRTPLEELVLQIKVLKLGMVLPFLQNAIEPPKEESVQIALQCLKDLNALTGVEELTPLGHHLANLPVNPRIGKIILFGAIFSCLDPVLTIASALGFKEPFSIPLHKQEEADATKKRFAGDTRSDHIALLRAFQGWEVAKQHGNGRHYCWDNFLANNTLELLQNMKGQFSGLLYDTGFISSSNPKNERANENSNNMKLVKAVLCAGLYPNVVKIEQTRPGSNPKLFTRDGKVKFHPKSVNCKETDFSSKYMIYHTRVKSSAVFIHDSSLIPPFPLLFFGGDITVKDKIISVDNWIDFKASHRVAELVKEMRKQLDSVLKAKVAQPRMELYNPQNPDAPATSQLIQAIIDLITREDYTDQAARVATGKHTYYRGK